MEGTSTISDETLTRKVNELRKIVWSDEGVIEDRMHHVFCRCVGKARGRVWVPIQYESGWCSKCIHSSLKTCYLCMKYFVPARNALVINNLSYCARCTKKILYEYTRNELETSLLTHEEAKASFSSHRSLQEEDRMAQSTQGEGGKRKRT